MRTDEFNEFLTGFLTILFSLYIKAKAENKRLKLDSKFGTTKIYDYPISDGNSKQQERARRALDDQRNQFQQISINECQIKVLISPDNYVVIELVNEENRIKFLAIKVVEEGIYKLKITGFNYPDNKGKYRSGCSAEDLVIFLQKFPKVKIIRAVLDRWNQRAENNNNPLNSEFLNPLLKNQEIGNKIQTAISRGKNWEFYFNLVNNLTKDKHIFQNIENYITLLNKETVYVKRKYLEKVAIDGYDNSKAIRISAPKGMGKRMLLEKIILPHAKKQKHQIVMFNCSEADDTVLNDEDKFLKWFLTDISIELDLEEHDINKNIDKQWARKNITSYKKATSFLETYILPQIPTGLVIVLDNLDKIFESASFYNNFCMVLRNWWLEKNNHNLWEKLYLILIITSEVYVKNNNVNFSPDVGVGLSSYFQEFNKDQIRQFIDLKQLNFTLNDTLVERIYSLIGGYPYLLDIALEKLKFEVDVELANNRNLTEQEKENIIEETLTKILNQAPTRNGIYSRYFSEISYLLGIGRTEDNGLVEAFRKIVWVNDDQGIFISSDKICFKLKSLGLVIKRGNNVCIRNALYKQYFREVIFQQL